VGVVLDVDRAAEDTGLRTLYREVRRGEDEDLPICTFHPPGLSAAAARLLSVAWMGPMSVWRVC